MSSRRADPPRIETPTSSGCEGIMPGNIPTDVRQQLGFESTANEETEIQDDAAFDHTLPNTRNLPISPCHPRSKVQGPRSLSSFTSARKSLRKLAKKFQEKSTTEQTPQNTSNVSEREFPSFIHSMVEDMDVNYCDDTTYLDPDRMSSSFYTDSDTLNTEDTMDGESSDTEIASGTDEVLPKRKKRSGGHEYHLSPIQTRVGVTPIVRRSRRTRVPIGSQYVYALDENILPTVAGIVKLLEELNEKLNVPRKG